MASRVAGSPSALLDHAVPSSSSFLSGRPSLSSSSTSFSRGSASRSRGVLSSKDRVNSTTISKKSGPRVKASLALAPALRSAEISTPHSFGSVFVIKAPPALRSIKRLISAVSARPAASRTSSAQTSAGGSEELGATGAGNPPESKLNFQQVEEPQSAAVPAIVLPHLPSRFALPTPRLNRRALLGIGVAALGAAAAAELGLVNAAAAEAGKEKSPLWFLGNANGGGVSVDGGAKSPAAPKGPESRVYDATAVGEPALLGDKDGVWQRLVAARVVYLGEAEMVRDPTDKVVALEIVSRLRDECFKAGRPVTLALSAFPRSTQPLLDKYLNKRLFEEDLQVAVSHWSKGRFEEMVPLLQYCRDSGVRLFACGVPPKVSGAPRSSPNCLVASLPRSLVASSPRTFELINFPLCLPRPRPPLLLARAPPPRQILRTVQAGGVQALAPIDRQRYAPPLGGFPAPSPSVSTDQLLTTSPSAAASATAGLWGLEPAAVAAEVYSREAVSRTSLPFGPGPYWFAQARVVEQHAMARSIDQAMADGGIVGLLVVLTGASQVRYGAQGSGVPARINNGQLKISVASQRVVLLNPERQRSRADGEMPEADFFWYSGSRMCTQNCFDRAEIARVMGAAGRTFDNLPQDLQTGIERGLISPDTLRSFFELESHPLVAEATKRFQGLRERVYADPRFLQRIVTEEAISVTTALLAQWEKRRDRFWSEIEYVATDVLRGVIVNFFTVWLPAPTLSFPAASAASSIAGSAAAGAAGAAQGPVQQLVSGVGAWAATLPKNAFQRATQPGQDWGLQQRLASILFTSGKLFTVGFSASVGTVALNNLFMEVKNRLGELSAAGAAGAAAGGAASASAAAAAGGGAANAPAATKRSPVLKTAAVYGGFLATSANLRYQVIGGVVEHWIADYYLAANPMAGAALSMIARTLNSYWGTSQWVDLARFAGLQTSSAQSSSDPASLKAIPAGSAAEAAAAAAAAAAEAAEASAAAAAALEQAYSASPSGFSGLTPIPVLVNSPLYAAASAGVPAFEAWQYAAPAAAAAEAAADRAVAAERVAAAAAAAAAEAAEAEATEKAAAAEAAAVDSESWSKSEAVAEAEAAADSDDLPLGIPALPEQISSFSVSESGESLAPATQETAPTSDTLPEAPNKTEGMDSPASLTESLCKEDKSEAVTIDRLMTSVLDSPLPLAALGLEITEAECSECGGAWAMADKEILLEAVELSVPSSPPMGSVISLEHVTRVGDVELLPSLDSSIPLDSLSLDSHPCLDSLPTLDSLPSLESLGSADSLELPAVVPGDGPAVSVLGEESPNAVAAAVPAATATTAAAAQAAPAAAGSGSGSRSDEQFSSSRDAVCA
ncbi:unnamed protein product [Closterium sp. NIES-54]